MCYTDIEMKRKAALMLALAIALTFGACSDSADGEPPADAGASTDAGSDAVADASMACPSPMDPRPKDGSPCATPGLVCDLGALSCWVKATCQSDNRWAITCGIIFPDGGPCC